jgi:tRNA-modifying protein YgfZ
VVDLSNRGKVRATGRDAVDYLHRMLSNDIKALAAGQNCYSFLLDAQGHILADMNVLMQAGSVLLDLEPGVAARALPHLDKFTFMDDVQFQDVTEEIATIGVESEALAANAATPETLIVKTPATTELLVPSRQKQEVWARLLEAGASVADPAAMEAARIEAGVPRYGVDFDERNIPHETGQLRAISFTKGCYPGQEIVERVRSRGHVNRLLAVLAAENDSALEPGAKLLAGGREAGHITSAAFSSGRGRWLAIALLRREFSEPETALDCAGTPVRVVRRC